MAIQLRQLKPDDTSLLNDLMAVFGEAFDDPDTYCKSPPNATYLRALLAGESFMALVALKDESVVGGLVAYQLKKFEPQRSEIYIYDLAVLPLHRREGTAKKMIEALKGIAIERKAWVIYVQADTGIEDQAAIALYSKLGVREDVLHFDIAVGSQPK